MQKKEYHRIGFNSSQIVFKCQNTQVRKLVEGALISFNSTFRNNKGATHENSFINFNICRVLNIRKFSNIVATLSPAALPLFSQMGDNHTIGTYADPRPPADPLQTIRQPRRSERLRRRVQNQHRISEDYLAYGQPRSYFWIMGFIL